MLEPLYFDDLVKGQRFTSAPWPMDRDRLLAFATEFDPQPQHTSDEAAAASQFGRLVASGWHTAALTMRMQVGGLGAQVDTLAWRSPVLPGDTLYAIIEITALRPSRSRPERGIASIHTTTYNQRDEAVMEQSAAVMLPRRPVAKT
jgi:acyl dehydratase